MSSGLEVTDPEAYRERLRDRLGGRGELEVLAETAQGLRDRFRDVPLEVVRARPFPGKWTPLEVLGHLVDAEWSFAWRLRTTLCDDRPSIEPMGQDEWVAVLRHNERTPSELLRQFTELRGFNLPIWSSLGPEQLSLVGVHKQRGEESLATMRLMLAGHDLSHLDQIDRYLAAAEEQQKTVQ